jgi:uncharacterized protein with HEPN domain
MPREGDAALPEDRERIRHMLVAAKDAMFFAQGRFRADLDADRMLARAVLHAIQEIGEAAARTTTASRQRAPHIPWGSVVQMRHILLREEAAGGPQSTAIFKPRRKGRAASAGNGR